MLPWSWHSVCNRHSWYIDWLYVIILSIKCCCYSFLICNDFPTHIGVGTSIDWVGHRVTCIPSCRCASTSSHRRCSESPIGGTLLVSVWHIQVYYSSPAWTSTGTWSIAHESISNSVMFLLDETLWRAGSWEHSAREIIESRNSVYPNQVQSQQNKTVFTIFIRVVCFSVSLLRYAAIAKSKYSMFIQDCKKQQQRAKSTCLDKLEHCWEQQKQWMTERKFNNHMWNSIRMTTKSLEYLSQIYLAIYK